MSTRGINNGAGMMPPGAAGMAGAAAIGAATMPTVAGVPTGAPPTDSYIPPTEDLARFDRLARLPSKEREQEELSELYRLHGEWIAGGGRTLFEPAFTKLPDLFTMMARGAELVVAGERAVLTSALWGTVDVRNLNGIKGRYLGNVGQSSLARDLAIVTGRLEINLQKFTNLIVPKETKKDERKEEVKARRWSVLPIDWRRYLYFGALGNGTGFFQSWARESGYDEFSLRYYYGDSHKAWLIASSLLLKDDFARLGWGKQKQTNVKEQEAIRAALMKGLEDGSYVGEAGYDKFAEDTFQGDSLKAWQVASSLLSKDDFARLTWGKQKKTNVKEQAAIRATLIKGLEDGTYVGEKGYDKFATDKFQGDSKKVWEVASSLLTKDAFARLTWGKQKQTNVKEQTELRAALMEGLDNGIYVGEAGYDMFATDRFQGDSLRAWVVASSLLSKGDFARLAWGKMKKTHVNEQADIRAALMAGIENGTYVGEAGYDRFATDTFQGDSMKAWSIASSLLSKDNFVRLAWGKMKKTHVNEQADIRAALMKGLEDGSYVGAAGYDRFATDRFRGDSLKAWQVASSLLPDDDFAWLQWGKQKRTNVKEQSDIHAALMKGLEDGTYVGEAGYDQFAVDTFQGESQKAWLIASSLLLKDDFARLGWGKQKQTNVKEQAELRTALRGGEYKDHEGQIRFAAAHYAGNPKKAYYVARSLLNDADYESLGWSTADALSGAYADEAFDLLGEDIDDFDDAEVAFAEDLPDGD